MTIIADAMARDTIAKIADNIELRGHYQGRGPTPSYLDPKQPCCVLINPAYPTKSADVNDRMHEILYGELGIEGVADWNDMTPTDIVLSELRRIAAAR